MPYRVALLALCFALPAFAQTAAPEEEKGVTTIDAESLQGVGDIEITARGNAEIRRDDMTIFGQELRFNQEFGRAQGEGGVRLQRGVDRFFGDRLEYNTREDTGKFENLHYLLQRERLARGSADELELLGRDKFRLKNAIFTTCQPGRDDWVLRAAQLDLDYENEEGHAKSPRLIFYDVPILGFPFASFPLENRRRSGLLAPYYSHTSTRGFEFGVPYYWNIAPERDLTVTPVYMAKRGLQVKNQARYLDRDYSGELKLEYMPEDRELGQSRSGTSWQHLHRFSPAMTAQVDYNHVSDNRYFVDLASQVRQISIGNLYQDAYVNYSGALGAHPYFAQARVQKFQTLQDPLAPIDPPYHRVPQLSFSTNVNNIGGLVDSVLPAEFVNFTHQTKVDGTRVTLSPTFALPLLSPGWFLTPKAGIRSVGYNLHRTDPGQPVSPHAEIPWMSADTGLIFERDTRFFGDTLTQTLEPRLFYVYVPYRNQDAIPIFDTALADFNFPQLFTENRFNGGDRFGDANQATLAVTTRFLQADGQELLRGTLGQRFYFRNERVALAEGSTLRVARESDVLASIGGRLQQRLTFDATTQYNPYDHRVERYSIGMRYAPQVAKVFNASYRFQRDLLRQVDLSGQWPVAAGWYAVGRYNYSFFDRRLLEGLAGAEYNAGCWVFRFVVQRLQAAAQVTSTALIFQLEFSGVGQIGTAEALQLLRRDIPGYSVINRTDPALAPPNARSRLPFEQVF